MNGYLGASTQADAISGQDGGLFAVGKKIPGVSSAHFLKLVEDRGTAGFWSCDLATGQCICSPGLLRLIGLDTVKSFSLMHLLDHVHPEDRNTCEDIWPLIRSGVPVNRDFRLVRADRTLRWVGFRSDVVLDADKRPARAIGLINDVSELNENRQALDESMGRYRALVGAVAALEWRATANGEPIFSRGWTALTGQPESEVLSGNWVNALHPDDRPVVVESWLKAVQTLTPYTANQRILKANGEYEWFHARAVPIMRQGGRPHEWLGMIIRHQDFIVTAHHPAEAETIVTPMQIRAGRAMLQWTLEDLSRESGVSVSSIRRIEAEGERSTRPASLAALRQAFERKGLAFREDNGVCLQRQP